MENSTFYDGCGGGERQQITESRRKKLFKLLIKRKANNDVEI